MSRLQWSDFVAALPKLTGGTLDDVPLIGDQAYIRELLQLAVMDDLLGPANGPHEQILDMGVRDRYLVGKLAPREDEDGGIEGLEGPLAAEAEEEPRISKFITGATSREPNLTARRAASMQRRIRRTRSMPPATSPSSLRASG